MFKLYSLILALFLIASMIFSSDGTKYGEDITLESKTQISEILATPDDFVGKKVLVEGTVINVCAKRGCWIEIAGDKESESIRVKVKDGEIIFPMEAKGKTALVEGEVYSFDVESETECSGNCQHKKSEEGEESAEHAEGEDHSEKCEHATKVKKVYQIKGFGAVI